MGTKTRLEVAGKATTTPDVRPNADATFTVDEAALGAAQEVHGHPTGPSGPLMHLPRAWLKLGKWLNRTTHDKEGLKELAESIRRDGIRTPLQAVKKGNHEYHIFSGKRRYLASEGVLEVLPVIVHAYIEDLQVERLALVSNLHREDLPPVDLANGLRKLADTRMTQAEIATALGKTPGWVSQYLSLLKLPNEAIKSLADGKITFWEARELQRIDDEPDMIKSILTKDAKGLSKRVGWVPDTVRDRVNRLLVKRQEEEKLAADMKAITDKGGVFVDDYKGYQDSNYIEINTSHYSNQAGQIHDEAKLTCEVYAVERGRIVRLCNDPKALRKLIKQKNAELPEADWDREQRERREREAAEHAAVGVVMAAWWSSKTPVAWDEMVAFARRDFNQAAQWWQPATLNAMASWLGWTGKKTEGQEMVKKLIAETEGKELLRLWWLYKVASTTSNTSYIMDWLTKHGYQAPKEAKRKANLNASVAEVNARIVERLDVAIRNDLDIGFDMICRTCGFTMRNVSATVARQEMENHMDHVISVDELPPKDPETAAGDIVHELHTGADKLRDVLQSAGYEGEELPLRPDEAEDLQKEAEDLEKVNGDGTPDKVVTLKPNSCKDCTFRVKVGQHPPSCVAAGKELLESGTCDAFRPKKVKDK